MEGCSPICIHFWVVISKLITLDAVLKFPVISCHCHWKHWASFQGISLTFDTTFLTGSDEKCSVCRPVMPNLSTQMNRRLIQVLRENCVLWLLLCHMTGLRGGHYSHVLSRSNKNK